MRAAVGESQARAGDDVSDGAGNQHFVWFGCSRDARRNMHGDTADIVADQLALACMESAADLESQRTQSLAHRAGASYRAVRSVEGSEQAVARRVHLAAAENGQLLAHRVVIVSEQLAPSLI